ncbi:zinc finger protein 629 isoform X2 [Cheilinus undulatus]|uniref:zinc finger protein 629 isoform X2 n=1 Tax=Cheilinus undulatus TaxID=241271 RepID=UPI001BD27894|nr:zinc finger protein 629 isoform X2 [Cheilinus undulatus]
MPSLDQRYRDISPVTLQVVGGAVSSSLYCGEVDGVGGGLVESFLVELYRCKLCQFTCSLKTSISSHQLLRHRPPTLTYLEDTCGEGGAEERGGAELQRGAEPYHLDLNEESKESEDDEDFLLYNMLDNMSPPTCDISSEGGLQVAHTCEVSTLFEEEQEEEKEDEASIFPLKAEPDLSCPIDPPATQEEIAQSAHLMTLGLCRISAAKPPPPPAPPPPPPPPPLGDPAGSLARSEPPPPQKKKRRLLCLLCPLKLPSRRLLDVHVRSHCAAGGFSCVSCSWRCERWAELEAHWRRHRRKRRGRDQRQEVEKKKKKRKTKSQMFGCPVCMRMFRSSASRDTHRNTHDGCEQRFHDDNPDGQRNRLIGRAERSKAGPSTRFVPSQTSGSAPASFQSLTETRRKTRPEEGEHGEEAGLYCSLCERKFSSKLTLRRHLSVHGGVKPFTCPHCSYSSRLKASLLQHLRTHTGEKPYRCTLTCTCVFVVSR